MKVQPLPQLIKRSITYKLVVPAEVEEKIRYLIRKFPSTEWSGVLFYSHEGSFEDGSLTIICRDILPMDLGTSGWTEFKMSEDVASYIADNIELFDCNIGLIHSHHSLGAFLSGQDTLTLQKEGNDTNCFVSLVVDTRGTYVAAITRKVQTKQEVTTKELNLSYEFFGDGKVNLQDEKQTPVTKTVENTIIEYFMMEVQRDVVNNPFDYLDARFEAIEQKKKERKNLTFLYDKPDKAPITEPFYDWMHNKERQAIQYDLFDKHSKFEKVEEKTEEFWTPDPQDIHAAVVSMVSCSLMLNSEKFDLDNWIVKNMQKTYDKKFTDSLSFTQWSEFIRDYILDYFPYPEDENFYDLYEDYRQVVADAIRKELHPYIDVNSYIREYYNAFDI